MLFLDLDCFQLKRRVIFSLQVVEAQSEKVNSENVEIADVAVAVRIEGDSIAVMVDDGTTVLLVGEHGDDVGIVAVAKGNNLHYESVHCHYHSVTVWYC